MRWDAGIHSSPLTQLSPWPRVFHSQAEWWYELNSETLLQACVWLVYVVRYGFRCLALGHWIPEPPEECSCLLILDNLPQEVGSCFYTIHNLCSHRFS